MGFRQVKGCNKEDAELLLSGRVSPYTSVQAVFQTGVSITTLEKLADADAFRSAGLDRRQALWDVSALQSAPNGIFSDQQDESEAQKVKLPQMELFQHVFQDYATTSLSLKAHPLSFAREQLSQLGVSPTASLKDLSDGMPVKVAGLVLVRQRPGTASGILFITLEDETGTANLVVFKHLFEQYRKEILQARLLMVEGKVQIEGEVIHVVVHRCYNQSALFHKMPDSTKTIRPSVDQNGELTGSNSGKAAHESFKKILPGGRNFH